MTNISMEKVKNKDLTAEEKKIVSRAKRTLDEKLIIKSLEPENYSLDNIIDEAKKILKSRSVDFLVVEDFYMLGVPPIESNKKDFIYEEVFLKLKEFISLINLECGS